MLEGHCVKVTSAAKTVADCFKFRNKIGTNIAVEALRDYLRQAKSWGPLLGVPYDEGDSALLGGVGLSVPQSVKQLLYNLARQRGEDFKRTLVRAFCQMSRGKKSAFDGSPKLLQLTECHIL